MKPYELYTVDDFIEDTDFQDWVQGHSERESFWLSFLEHYPHQWVAFQQAERFIRAVRVAPEPLGEQEVRKEVERFLETDVSYRTHRHAVNPVVHPRFRRPVVLFPHLSRVHRVVWVLILAVVLGGYWWSNRPVAALAVISERAVAEPLVETTNNTRNLLRVVLTDGSEVMLSPKSELRYPARFTQKNRIVYLRGEAVFAVKRQAQPFLVYTGNMVTKVLGTRFVVRAFDEDRKITVQVLSGKVSVYQEKPDKVTTHRNEVKGLILTVNQAAIFEKNDGNLTKTLIANPTLLTKTIQPQPFSYDEVPLPVILHELEKAYGIPIQFDAQVFESSKITAVLSDESLYEKLDLLCKAASATYEITDGQIIISQISSHRTY